VGKILKWTADPVKVGLKPLLDLSDSVANNLLDAIIYIFLLEIKIGLGLDTAENVNKEIGANFDEEGLVFFDKVDALYQKIKHDCYFCDNIDPNKTQYSENTELCADCQMRVANILQYYGINPSLEQNMPFILRKRKTQKLKKTDILGEGGNA